MTLSASGELNRRRALSIAKRRRLVQLRKLRPVKGTSGGAVPTPDTQAPTVPTGLTAVPR